MIMTAFQITEEMINYSMIGPRKHKTDPYLQTYNKNKSGGDKKHEKRKSLKACEINTIPIKISTAFFCRNRKIQPKIHMEP